MNGKKVTSNERRLWAIWCVLAVAWTCCCGALILSTMREIEAERVRPSIERIIRGERSKSEVFWVGAAVWGGGLGLILGACALFWRVSYRIEYEENVIAVEYSWPRKRLFVDGELQDEDDDFAFSRVVLHGRIKSGDAAGKEVGVSCTFGTYTPVCVNIDDRVVFKG